MSAQKEHKVFNYLYFLIENQPRIDKHEENVLVFKTRHVHQFAERVNQVRNRIKPEARKGLRVMVESIENGKNMANVSMETWHGYIRRNKQYPYLLPLYETWATAPTLADKEKTREVFPDSLKATEHFFVPGTVKTKPIGPGDTITMENSLTVILEMSVLHFPNGMNLGSIVYTRNKQVPLGFIKGISHGQDRSSVEVEVTGQNAIKLAYSLRKPRFIPRRIWGIYQRLFRG